MAKPFIRGCFLKPPVHTLMLEGFLMQSGEKPPEGWLPNPVLELKSQPNSSRIKVKIGESVVEIDAQTLLSAVATLTPKPKPTIYA